MAREAYPQHLRFGTDEKAVFFVPSKILAGSVGKLVSLGKCLPCTSLPVHREDRPRKDEGSLRSSYN